METETAKSLASYNISSINEREYSMAGKKSSHVHKQAGEKIIMNIQTNLESMDTLTGKKTSRH